MRQKIVLPFCAALAENRPKNGLVNRAGSLAFPFDPQSWKLHKESRNDQPVFPWPHGGSGRQLLERRREEGYRRFPGPVESAVARAGRKEARDARARLHLS